LSRTTSNVSQRSVNPREKKPTSKTQKSIGLLF
jgi:hypothetical protein